MKLASRVCREMAGLLEHEKGRLLAIRRSQIERWILWLAPTDKKRPREKVKSTRSVTVKELDDLCREAVLARDGKKCRWDGCLKTTSLQWCHCYSRRYKWLRWDFDNSFTLCAGHHLAWHHKPLEGAAWWEKELGPERYLGLVRRASRPSKVNLVAVREYLTQRKES